MKCIEVSKYLKKFITVCNRCIYEIASSERAHNGSDKQGDTENLVIEQVIKTLISDLKGRSHETRHCLLLTDLKITYP